MSTLLPSILKPRPLRPDQMSIYGLKATPRDRRWIHYTICLKVIFLNLGEEHCPSPNWPTLHNVTDKIICIKSSFVELSLLHGEWDLLQMYTWTGTRHILEKAHELFHTSVSNKNFSSKMLSVKSLCLSSWKTSL